MKLISNPPYHDTQSYFRRIGCLTCLIRLCKRRNGQVKVRLAKSNKNIFLRHKTPKCCATNWKVAGSIPAGVSGYFIDIKSFRFHYGPGVDSISNRNEYQKYLLRVKAAGP